MQNLFHICLQLKSEQGYVVTGCPYLKISTRSPQRTKRFSKSLDVNRSPSEKLPCQNIFCNGGVKRKKFIPKQMGRGCRCSKSNDLIRRNSKESSISSIAWFLSEC
ncbi:hypothetical protein ACJW30_04G065800 [Castanea mollissima]